MDQAQQNAPASGARTTLTQPKSKSTASGQGAAVGQVYRLPDGRLVLVNKNGGP